MTVEAPSRTVDLVVANARAVETMAGPGIAGGWVAIDGGVVADVGPRGSEPAGRETLDASGCLVTPGLINTHHHIFQNLTRAFAPVANRAFVDWITTLAPIWERMDEEATFVSTWIGLAELALGGCTTTTDHHYVHVRPNLIDAQVLAARDIGVRFHPTRGSADIGPGHDSILETFAQDIDLILADCARLVETHHDRSASSMVRIGFAPSSPFDSSPDLYLASAELAEQLDVRLHTHIAQVPEEEAFCLARFGRRPVELLEDVGWGSSRSWVAHCIFPRADDIRQLGAWGTGIAHCPSSNLLICNGIAPVAELRMAGAPVGLGCDGSASTDHASLWLEAKTAYGLARYRSGPTGMRARDVLEMATIGSAACLGREGEIGVLAPGACGDLAVWPLDGILHAGAVGDPVEAWLRCGPSAPRHTVVAGRPVVRDGYLVHPAADEILARHHAIATDWQGVAHA